MTRQQAPTARDATVTVPGVGFGGGAIEGSTAVESTQEPESASTAPRSDEYRTPMLPNGWDMEGMDMELVQRGA
jgi:hypothetical protein